MNEWALFVGFGLGVIIMLPMMVLMRLPAKSHLDSSSKPESLEGSSQEG